MKILRLGAPGVTWAASPVGVAEESGAKRHARSTANSRKYIEKLSAWTNGESREAFSGIVCLAVCLSPQVRVTVGECAGRF